MCIFILCKISLLFVIFLLYMNNICSHVNYIACYYRDQFVTFCNKNFFQNETYCKENMISNSNKMWEMNKMDYKLLYDELNIKQTRYNTLKYRCI